MASRRAAFCARIAPMFARGNDQSLGLATAVFTSDLPVLDYSPRVYFDFILTRIEDVDQSYIMILEQVQNRIQRSCGQCQSLHGWQPATRTSL